MYQDIITYISLFFSVFGAIIIVYGGLRAIISIIKVEILKKSLNYNSIRSDFTQKIVIALEFFIAADLIRTVIQPTLDEVVILAVIVSIRTVVGYTLDKEAKDIISNQ
ncbi:MAG: DUF1622 domain-containing protein [Methanobacterium sp.]